MTPHREQIEVVGNGLLIRAPAKINLSLLVAGKRSDGFHELETVMAKINLYDEIFIEAGNLKGIELVCSGDCWSPEGSENLVYKAAKMVVDEYGGNAKVKITLRKNIPAGSGLGSGSSDAAATLIGVSKFLGSGTTEEQKLGQMAAQLGSDVAFFLGGPLAFCKGKGEKIQKLTENFDFSAFLVIPNVTVSTKEVYDNYKHERNVYNQLSSKINTLIGKNRIDLVTKMCANMLEESCFCLHKELAELKAKIESFDIRPVCLSGSGSAMFCIVDKRKEGKIGAEIGRLEREIGCKSVIVNSNRW